MNQLKIVDFSNLKGKLAEEQGKLLLGKIYNNRKVIAVRYEKRPDWGKYIIITTKCIICGYIHTYCRVLNFKKCKQCSNCYASKARRPPVIYIGMLNSRKDRVVDNYNPYIIKCLKCGNKIRYKKRLQKSLEDLCKKCSNT